MKNRKSPDIRFEVTITARYTNVVSRCDAMEQFGSEDPATIRSAILEWVRDEPHTFYEYLTVQDVTVTVQENP